MFNVQHYRNYLQKYYNTIIYRILYFGLKPKLYNNYGLFYFVAS